MSPNPFVTVGPQGPDQLINRSAEWQLLLSLAEDGHHARLSAPRRFGKTTLLGKVRHEADLKGMPVVYVDFFGILSTRDIAVRMEDAYYEGLKGPLARWYMGVRRRWRPTGRLRAPGAEVALHEREDDATRMLHDLLELPTHVFARSGVRTLVIFDEFQELLAAGEGVEGLFRSKIQHHRDQASYIFAGSRPGMLAEMFGSRKRPFFDQARPVELPPLPDTDLAEYVLDQFHKGQRDATPSIEPLLDLVRGHPQRAMLLAHHLWEVTPRHGVADEERWNIALQSALANVQEGFEGTWEELTRTQRRAISAVAWVSPAGGGSSLYGKDTLARFQLSKGATRDGVNALVKRGDVVRGARGQVQIVDPLLEAWLVAGRRPAFGPGAPDG